MTSTWTAKLMTARKSRRSHPPSPSSLKRNRPNNNSPRLTRPRKSPSNPPPSSSPRLPLSQPNLRLQPSPPKPNPPKRPKKIGPMRTRTRILKAWKTTKTILTAKTSMTPRELTKTSMMTRKTSRVRVPPYFLAQKFSKNNEGK